MEYLRGILDAASDSSIEIVVVQSCAQGGKTEIILNALGRNIDQNPGPALVVQPTLDMGSAFSKDRLAPMARDTPALRGKIKDARSRDSENEILHKKFPGGHVTIAGANSPSSLASRPIRDLYCDEIDRYPASAGTEGDPAALARKRTTTFYNRKIIYTSTPTKKGVSRINHEYLLSDQRQYFVPCKHCGHKQVLIWENVKWTDRDPETAAYACADCGTLWSEPDRHWAVKNGEWIAQNPEVKNRAGFHFNQIYSPWRTLADTVTEFFECKDVPEMLQTFVNTVLGEVWEEQGEVVDWDLLAKRRAQYDAEVPKDVCLLTIGVDVQQDRLEAEIVGWSPDQQSWTIDYKVIWGDTSEQPVWDGLTELLGATWQHENGFRMKIAGGLIDSGYRASIVYDYVLQHKEDRIFASKGLPGEGRPVVAAPTKKKTVASRKKVQLFIIGPDAAKDIVHARLGKSEPGPGYCHFHERLTEEYFKQLTSEKAVVRFHKGRPKREWIKIRARNEALDTRVLNLAAVEVLNPVWDILVKNTQPKEPAAEEPKQDPIMTARKKGAGRKTNFVNRYKRR